MGLHQTKELLHSRRNSHQTPETAHRMGENLCKLLIWSELISRIYREFNKTQPPKNQHPHELITELSKEEIQMATKYMKKCSTFMVIKEMQIQTKQHLDFISPQL
jgi:hypothetical protein